MVFANLSISAALVADFHCREQGRQVERAVLLRCEPMNVLRRRTVKFIEAKCGHRGLHKVAPKGFDFAYKTISVILTSFIFWEQRAYLVLWMNQCPLPIEQVDFDSFDAFEPVLTLASVFVNNSCHNYFLY